MHQQKEVQFNLDLGKWIFSQHIAVSDSDIWDPRVYEKMISISLIKFYDI